jgi:hypothetical protein
LPTAFFRDIDADRSGINALPARIQKSLDSGTYRR